MVELSYMENKFLYKPDIETQIIKDFLDIETNKELKEYVYDLWNKLYYNLKDYNKLQQDSKGSWQNRLSLVVKKDDGAGKTFVNIGPNEFPEKFYKKAEEHAKKINPNVKFEYVSIVKYAKEFSNPILRPHFDIPSKVAFILDYQLDGNTTWPLVVNLEEYVLQNNQALAFDNNLTIHWRKPQIFKENEYLYMIFFSFVDESKIVVDLQGQHQEISKFLPIYSQQHEEVFGRDNVSNKEKRSQLTISSSIKTDKLAELFEMAKKRNGK